MEITDDIDKRIETITILRKQAIMHRNINSANQLWARLEELKALKNKHSDKDGNWEV